MGKREQRKTARREAILDIAQQSFLQQGYDRTTMSGISELMGGSKGTLWSYFDSKEALFEAVIDRAGVAFRADLIAALDNDVPSDEALHCFAQTFIRKVTSFEAIALQRMVVGECSRFPHLSAIFYARAPGAMRDLLVRYIDAQMAAGRLKRGDPVDASNILLSLCAGGHHQRVLWGLEPRSEETIDNDANRAANFFLQVYGVDSHGEIFASPEP